MLYLFIISVLLPVILMFLNLILYKKHNLSRNKPSAFECGFEPKLLARIPFSLKFYLISIMFLIFDIEIALILPMPILFHSNFSTIMNISACIFLCILFIGLILEWHEGAIKWMY